MFSGNSSQASNGAGSANYIEDVFSTWLYTGNGSTQTITNGIDLAGKGGMLWVKGRSNAYNHFLFDTAQGIGGAGTTYYTSSNTTGAAGNLTDLLYANSNGFAWGANVGAQLNNNGSTFASWTFRKQPKFFDVVTYTGNGTTNNVSHSLGSTPGFILIKKTSGTGDWIAICRKNDTQGIGLYLNSTAANYYDGNWPFGIPVADATTLKVSWINDQIVAGCNDSGSTYVAYLFAHNAGGFGAAGTDNVISCGSYSGSASELNVTLGYEPQWLLIKRTDSAGYDWNLVDVMRGASLNATKVLRPNTSGAEDPYGPPGLTYPTSSGFSLYGGISFLNASGGNYIYIAIRRGPMKTPTSGTSVFGLNARTGTGANATVTGSAGVSDAVLIKNRGSAVGDLFASRLTGTGYLETSSTAAEVAAGTTILQANPWDVMDGVKVGTTSTITNASSNTYINYLFDRAPGFFDEVCYTGTGSATTQTHNLGVAPELMIVKRRDTAGTDWRVWAAAVNGGNARAFLNDTAAFFLNDNGVIWGNGSTYIAPTATQFSVSANSSVGASGGTYVAYLFASCPGVSKVGSYTGTGATQTINCGFTGGARFVLIKRTDSTGDWYVWDSARGIVAGNDPYLLLNSTAAEVTSTDYIDPVSSGFEISSTAPAAINANGGTYIYLAIA